MSQPEGYERLRRPTLRSQERLSLKATMSCWQHLKTKCLAILLLFATIRLSDGIPITIGPIDRPDFITEQVIEVVGDWWPILANGDILISFPSFDRFFQRYQDDVPPSLLLLEDDFINGDSSWTQDFADHGMTAEYSRAYFRSLDVYLEQSLIAQPRITMNDVDDMILICEKYSGKEPMGFIDKATFIAGFSEVIMRGVSFSLMFVRFNNNTKPLQKYEALDEEEFFDIFHAMDESGDWQVTVEECEDFWEDGQYGPRSMANTLFNKLDIQSSGFLNLQQWQDLFHHLDCRDSDDDVDIEEFFQLDLILHDLASYPSEDCILERLPDN